jgi:glycosyltransferase involved in cell wall biosynthesis
MSSKHLVLITSGFPFGRGETFLEAEVPILSKQFENITIICPIINGEPREIPENIRIIQHDGYIKVNYFILLKALIYILTSKEIFKIYKYLKSKDWFYAIKIAVKDLHNAIFFKQVISRNFSKKNEMLYYTYWTDYQTLALALLKRENKIKDFVTRFHRWDLYFDTHDIPYLPFRSLIATEAKKLFFISQHGKTYFEELQWIKGINPQTVLSRLGTSKLSMDNIPKSKKNNAIVIVSVSSLIERKRVYVIKELIFNTSLNIIWYHFGDGEQRTIFENIPSHLKEKINWMGSISNSDLHEWYINNYVDLFINVSISEGIPVSIMEALSYGIPIIATNIDGNPEIVNNNFNGFLIDTNDCQNELKNTLINYSQLNDEKKAQLKKNAYNTWEEKYNAETNFKAFGELLKLNNYHLKNLK